MSWPSLIQQGDLRRKRNMHNWQYTDKVLRNLTGMTICENCKGPSTRGRFCCDECFEEYEEMI